MKPMSDLCWVCQRNSVAMIRNANRPEGEKSEVCTVGFIVRKQKFIQINPNINRYSGTTHYTWKKFKRRGMHTGTLNFEDFISSVC